MAELVEQGGDFVVSQQRGPAFERRREVAHQVRDRRLQRPFGPGPAGAHVVHPGARALAGARVRVEVELADQLRTPLDAEEAHAGVPHGRAVGPDAHLEQRLDDAEQALEHLGLGEVLLHLLVAERIAGLLQLLAGVGHVPRLQVGQAELVAGEVAQLLQVALGVRTGPPRQVAQELHHLLRRVGHLRHQRHLCIAGVAQQPGLFLAQRQQLAHGGAVVERRRAELAGARDVGRVQRLAQRAVVAVLQHGEVAGEVQSELVALLAFGLRGGPRGFLRVVGHAGHLGCAGVVRVTVGRVEHVLGELLPQRRQLFLHLLETLLGGALQLGARQHEVAHRVRQRLAARRAERGRRRGIRDRLVLGIEPLVGRVASEELGDLG